MQPRLKRESQAFQSRAALLTASQAHTHPLSWTESRGREREADLKVDSETALSLIAFQKMASNLDTQRHVRSTRRSLSRQHEDALRIAGPARSETPSLPCCSRSPPPATALSLAPGLRLKLLITAAAEAARDARAGAPRDVWQHLVECRAGDPASYVSVTRGRQLNQTALYTALEIENLDHASCDC